MNGGRGIEGDRSHRRDQIDELLGDPALGPGVVPMPLCEGLRAEGDGATSHPSSDAQGLQLIEVAADRHLAHPEVGGQLIDSDRTALGNQVLDLAQTLFRAVERAPAHSASPSRFRPEFKPPETCPARTESVTSPAPSH